MKKLRTLTIALCVALVACACCMMTACTKPNFAGTYKFESMHMVSGGMTLDYAVGQEITPGVAITEDFMVLELREDGTAALISQLANTNVEGTWTAKDNKTITLTFYEDSQDCACDGTTLTMAEDEDGVTSSITFKKK